MTFISFNEKKPLVDLSFQRTTTIGATTTTTTATTTRKQTKFLNFKIQIQKNKTKHFL